VAFPPEKPTSIGDQVFYFWQSGEQLVRLHNHSYLVEVKENGKTQYDLQVGFRFLPTQSRQELLGNLVKNGKLTSDGAKELEAILPAQLNTGWGKEYVALYRSQWSSAVGGYHGDRTVAKKLKGQYLDFSCIGMEASFPTDDDCESFSVSTPAK
jgi:hypothetical protein